MNLFTIKVGETFSELLYKLLEKKDYSNENHTAPNREEYSTICFRAAGMKPNELAIVVEHG